MKSSLIAFVMLFGAYFMPWSTPEPIPSSIVTATCYHAVSGECDSDPLTTAGMYHISSAERAGEHHYLAVSRDLLAVYPYGTKVRIKGTDGYDGIYEVADTMHRRFESAIDILISTGSPVGKWDNVIITSIN